MDLPSCFRITTLHYLFLSELLESFSALLRFLDAGVLLRYLIGKFFITVVFEVEL